mgnify:CR=1 FL=1
MHDKAVKLTLKEIESLPLGAVVWIEEHDTLDYDIPYYKVYPMLITVPGSGGCIGYATNEMYETKDIDNLLISEKCIVWDKRPDEKEIKNGLPISEALKIFNQIEERSLELNNIIQFPTK